MSIFQTRYTPRVLPTCRLNKIMAKGFPSRREQQRNGKKNFRLYNCVHMQWSGLHKVGDLQLLNLQWSNGKFWPTIDGCSMVEPPLPNLTHISYGSGMFNRACPNQLCGHEKNETFSIVPDFTIPSQEEAGQYILASGTPLTQVHEF